MLLGMWLGSLAEIFVAYAATEAVLAVAIYFLELYQGLGVCRIGGIKPCVVPHFYNVVLLGLQLLKQAEAAGTHLIVSFVPAISEEHGDYSIDDDHVERLAGKGLGRFAACLTEIIMCLPVWSHRSRESGLKLLDRLATENIAKAGTA